MDTAYGAPPAAPPRRRRGVVLPLLLIGAGTVFFLQNLGILSRDVWHDVGQAFVRFWPLLLVVLGLDLMLRDHLAVALRALLVALVFAGVLVASASTGGRPLFAGVATVSNTSFQPLEGARQGAVTLRFGAGRLVVDKLETGMPGQLASMTYSGPEALQPRPMYRVRDGVGELSYELPRDRNAPFNILGSGAGAANMNLDLAPDVPLNLRFETGASDTRLDLAALRVSQLDLEAGASQVYVRLPAAGVTTATIHGGAAALTVEVPPGVALRARYDGGLSNVEVDQNRFPSVGTRVFQSPDYDTAANKVDLNLELGASTVTIS